MTILVAVVCLVVVCIGYAEMEAEQRQLAALGRTLEARGAQIACGLLVIVMVALVGIIVVLAGER